MSTKRIVFVSRLDKDCSLGAFLLCKIAPSLIKLYNEIEIYIVGGGEEYNKISSLAAKINAKFNHKFIFATGYSNNPSLYFTKETLFVGVSRSAIEAMAHKIPVILLGNEGYLGLLEKSNHQSAIKTNLTCRNSKKIVSGNVLLQEINRFFSMTKDERENLSNFSFKIAKKYFSAEECARQTLNFYQKVIDSSKSINKETKIALCGYYGRGNFGDESILCEIKKQIKEASKKPTKILLIQSSAPFRIIPNLARADLFIFGGGSLLQNSTSNKSLIFYLTVIFTANILCKRKIMLSNGFGPINDDGFFGKLLIEALKHALNTFSFISTRDKKSQELIGSLIPQRKIHLVFDPAMVYFAEQEDFNNHRLFFAKETSARIVPNPKQGKCNHKIIYIPGKRALSRAKISESQVSNLLKHLSKKLNAEIIIAALSREDEESANKIAQRMGHCKVAHINSRKQLIVLLKGAKICISQRYHGALYSFYCKTPTLVISNDPKMKTLCKELGSSASMPTNIFKNLQAFLLCAEREIELNSQIREEIHFKIIKRAAKTEQKMQEILRYFI